MRVEGFAAEGRTGGGGGAPRLLLLVPPLLLCGVIASSIAGRPAVSAPALTARESGAAASSAAIAAIEPGPTSGAAATASPRSDWPAAIGSYNGPDAILETVRRPREEGTDGLMGGLPFGLENDNPYPKAEPTDWQTIYDERKDWHADRPSPRTKRLGGTNNFRTDPYQA